MELVVVRVGMRESGAVADSTSSRDDLLCASFAPWLSEFTAENLTESALHCIVYVFSRFVLDLRARCLAESQPRQQVDSQTAGLLMQPVLVSSACVPRALCPVLSLSHRRVLVLLFARALRAPRSTRALCAVT